MSHITRIQIKIKSLIALKKAAEAIGLEFVEGKTEYKWYGRFMNDTKLPPNIKVEDLGKCNHVLRIPNNKTAYEIGVVEAKDGKGGYELLWDFWQGGYGLQEKIGKNGEKLTQNYSKNLVMMYFQQNKIKVAGKPIINDKGQMIFMGVK